MKNTVNMPSVTAVVVTYNRHDLLLKTIDGLARQTYRPEAVIVVDNASDEATFDAIRGRGWLPQEATFVAGPVTHDTCSDGFDITYVRLNENEGGAGGFHEGLKRACEGSSDWFLLMDDDVEPVPEMLSSMMAYRHDSECIHPLKQYSDGTAINWEGHFSEISGRTIWNENQSFKQGKDHVEVNYGCFEGMLVSRNIVEKVGLPDKRFFIVNDDLIYGWLASKLTKVLYVNHLGLIKHRPIEKRITFLGFSENEIGPVTQFFNIRNQFLLVEYLKRAGSPALLVTTLMYVKFCKELLQAVVSRDTATLQMIVSGIKDGWQKKFGPPDFLKPVQQ